MLLGLGEGDGGGGEGEGGGGEGEGGGGDGGGGDGEGGGGEGEGGGGEGGGGEGGGGAVVTLLPRGEAMVVGTQPPYAYLSGTAEESQVRCIRGCATAVGARISCTAHMLHMPAVLSAVMAMRM